MKHDYINFVNLKQNDDGAIGDVFKDSNSNGPYDFLFPKLKKYYFYGELPEKYILNSYFRKAQVPVQFRSGKIIKPKLLTWMELS